MKELVLGCLCLFSALCNAQLLTPEQQQQDVEQAVKSLKKYNKGLYLFLPEQEFKTIIEEINQNLYQERSPIDFYRLIAPMVLPIKERHVQFKHFHKKSSIAKDFEAGNRLFFPFAITYQTDTSAYIIRNVSQDSTIQLPSKLLAINNLPIADVRDSIAQYIPLDYDTYTWQNFEISAAFPQLYHFFVDTTSVFTITIEDSLQQVQQKTITGVSKKEYKTTIIKQSKEIYASKQRPAPFRYKMYDSLSIGYLDINTFAENKVKVENNRYKYKKVVDEFFQSVHQKNIDHVIIDVRNNTGGSVSNVKYLLSYFQPFTEQTPFYSTQKDSWLFGEKTKEQSTYKQREPHFSGKVYILTNGGSYSASVLTSMFAKIYNQAMIVGEEPGGRPSGTTAGSFKTIKLKHSKIVLSIPRAVFTYNHAEQLSLSPDIEINPHIDDYFSLNKDHQLEYLIAYIQTKDKDIEFESLLK